MTDGLATGAISWQERDLVGMMQNLVGRPGDIISFDKIKTQWTGRTAEADLTHALSGLVSRGLLTSEAGGYALTEAGFYL